MTMLNTAMYVEKMEALFYEKRWADIRELLLPLEPYDVAQILSEVKREQLPLVYRLLPKEMAAEVFVEMDSGEQELLLQGFSDEELKAVVDELYVDDAVDLIEEMPANVVKRILRHADKEMRKTINELLNYPEDSAGTLMTTELVDFKAHYTVREAIERLRKIAAEMETINVCYVTDEGRRLLGFVTIRDLLLAKPEDLIGDLMDTDVVSVHTTMDKELVAQEMQDYDFLALPVVDNEGRLVGIITIDDALDVLEEEATEDMERMAAITPSERPYLKTPNTKIFLARIPWLLFLMVSATFTGVIIARYEHALSACVALTGFIPMLMDTGGNCGSQSSVTVIRGLSLQEVRFSDWGKVIWKETCVSLLCGLTLAAINFAKMMLIDRMLLGNTGITFTVAAVVCLTLVVTVFCSKVVGALLPIGAKKIGLDPAVMASPFITTIVDAISLVIYFTFASWMLGI